MRLREQDSRRANVDGRVRACVYVAVCVCARAFVSVCVCVCACSPF
jgi:hypothetical protein